MKMWKGKQTKELENLYDKYYDMFKCEPDWYDEVCYSSMSYDDYVGCIQKALQSKKELPDIIDDIK